MVCLRREALAHDGKVSQAAWVLAGIARVLQAPPVVDRITSGDVLRFIRLVGEPIFEVVECNSHANGPALVECDPLVELA